MYLSFELYSQQELFELKNLFHAATEPAQQETETSENVEASASRGSNVGNQYASKSATTTEMPSKSTQSDLSFELYSQQELFELKNLFHF